MPIIVEMVSSYKWQYLNKNKIKNSVAQCQRARLNVSVGLIPPKLTIYFSTVDTQPHDN